MLDTKVCIFAIKSKPHAVREMFERQHGRLSISAVTLMELIYGAEKFPAKNLAVIEGFSARLDVLSDDKDAAADTGQLRAGLARAGTSLAPYDQMISGHARSKPHLVTNNLGEFRRVPGLRIEDLS